MTRWVLDRLDLALRDHGERIDAIALPLGLGYRRNGYLRHLCDLYGFVVAVEASFAFTHALELAFIERRITSGRIAADMLGLGLTSASYAGLARCCAVPAFDAPLVGLGWIYAIDRMGPAHARLRAELAPGLPARFLASRSPHAARWDELGAVLARWTRTEHDFQQLLGAATAALTCLEGWFAGAAAPPSLHVEPQDARSAWR